MDNIRLFFFFFGEEKLIVDKLLRSAGRRKKRIRKSYRDEGGSKNKLGAPTLNFVNAAILGVNIAIWAGPEAMAERECFSFLTLES